MRIERLKEEYINDICFLHSEALYGDFLPSLGYDFLKIIYESIVENDFGFVCFKDDKIIGFIVGSKDISQLFKKTMRTRFFALTKEVLIKLVTKPLLIFNIIESFLYPDGNVKPELVIIVIKQGYRGQGIGRRLVNELENEFRKNNINKYRVTVKEKPEANFFYTRLDFNYEYEFGLFGKKWTLYTKGIK